MGLRLRRDPISFKKWGKEDQGEPLDPVEVGDDLPGLWVIFWTGLRPFVDTPSTARPPAGRAGTWFQPAGHRAGCIGQKKSLFNRLQKLHWKIPMELLELFAGQLFFFFLVARTTSRMRMAARRPMMIPRAMVVRAEPSSPAVGAGSTVGAAWSGTAGAASS